MTGAPAPGPDGIGPEGDGLEVDGQWRSAWERAWRDERVAVLAGIARRLGDLQAAEDAVQDAFAAAAARWPRDGVPDRPGAWLTTTAWRRALDGVRRERRHLLVATPEGDPGGGEDQGQALRGRAGVDRTDPVDDLGPVARDDDVLALVLTCCHPALSPEAQVALTLRHVVGLSDRQIAARFLLPEPTVTKRLIRARAKIRDTRVAFGLPDRAQLGERLDEVRAVVYLVFTEGHLASDTERAVRADLCEEAVWLARQVHRLVPHDQETVGLLALLLLHHARTPAREDAGMLVPYARQDRNRWSHDLVDEARVLLAATTGPSARPPGPYELQAAIALLHAVAAPGDEPDWAAIARLYGALARVAPSPVVEVNRAVAVGRCAGPVAGLDVLRPVLADRRLERYLPLLAAHADLLERAGDPSAGAAWRRAADLAPSAEQRRELQERARRAAHA